MTQSTTPPCFHSMVKPDCLSCQQGAVARLDAEIQRSQRAMFEGRCCIAAHQGFVQAEVLIHDDTWGWLALCRLHAAPIPLTVDRVDRRPC